METSGQENINDTDKTNFDQVPQQVHQECQLELKQNCRVLVPLRVGGDIKAPWEAVTGLCQERRLPWLLFFRSKGM